MVNGARGRRFDASYKRHPVTESSYINSLANRSYRSTVKTLPATLPEPWAVIRGQRLAVKASRLAPRGRRTGVTWAGCEIWIDLGRGAGRMLAGLTLQTCIGDGLVAPLTSGLVRTCNEAQTLHKLPIWFTSLIAGIEASLVNFRLRAHAYRQCYGTGPGAGQPN